MRLIPADSPILARQLEVLRDPQRLWSEHGLRSLRVLRLTLHLDEPLPNKLRRPFTSHRANHFPNLKQVKFKAD